MLRSEVNPWVAPVAGDDERFLAAVERIVDAFEKLDTEHLRIVRIKNWFDEKWLGFSGKGLVPFDFPWNNHDQVALDGFRQEKVTFPPFTPKRVTDEYEWARDGAEPTKRVHRRRLERSAANLHRRVSDFSRSLQVFWISTNSASNGRASVMSYRSCDADVDTWYAGFRRDQSVWHVDRVKGISRERVVSMIGEKAA
jgi:hypothetical protein